MVVCVTTSVVYMLFFVQLRDGSRRYMMTQMFCVKFIKILTCMGNCITQPLALAIFYSSFLVNWVSKRGLQNDTCLTALPFFHSSYLRNWLIRFAWYLYDLERLRLMKSWKNLFFGGKLCVIQNLPKMAQNGQNLSKIRFSREWVHRFFWFFVWSQKPVSNGIRRCPFSKENVAPKGEKVLAMSQISRKSGLFIFILFIYHLCGFHNCTNGSSP